MNHGRRHNGSFPYGLFTVRLGQAVGKIAVIKGKIKSGVAKAGRWGKLVDKSAGIGDGGQRVQHIRPSDDAPAWQPVLFVYSVIVGDMHGEGFSWDSRRIKSRRRLVMGVVGIHTEPGARPLQQRLRFLGCGAQAASRQALDGQMQAFTAAGG